MSSLSAWSRLRWLPAAVAAATVVAVVAGAAPPAHAATDTILLACPGNQTVNWDPGLLLTQRTVTTSGSTTLGPCMDIVGHIVSGGSTFAFDEQLSCLTVGSQSPGTEHFTWSTGETTSFSWTASEINTSNGLGLVVVTIHTDIESGKFAGMHLTYVITSATLHLANCLQEPGLSTSSGAIALTIHPTEHVPPS